MGRVDRQSDGRGEVVSPVILYMHLLLHMYIRKSCDPLHAFAVTYVHPQVL
jgi:hypothetical protein